MIRLFNGLMVVLFLIAAGLQFNDPDPVPWITIYFLAMCACIAWETGWLNSLAAVPLMVTAIGWGAWILANMKLEVPVARALTDWRMHSGGSEEIREALGLAIVALWMLVLAFTRREVRSTEL